MACYFEITPKMCIYFTFRRREFKVFFINIDIFYRKFCTFNEFSKQSQKGSKQFFDTTNKVLLTLIYWNTSKFIDKEGTVALLWLSWLYVRKITKNEKCMDVHFLQSFYARQFYKLHRSCIGRRKF